jgi:hypothetical protein
LIQPLLQSEALHVTFRSSKTSSSAVNAHRPGRDYSLGLPLSAQFSCQFAGFNGGAKNTALAPLSGAQEVACTTFCAKEETAFFRHTKSVPETKDANARAARRGLCQLFKLPI